MDKRTWQKQFGETVPLGYRLRVDFADRWLRLHSLPQSKRFADGEAEYGIILQRANALCAELFGEHTKVEVLYSRPSDISADFAHDHNDLFESNFGFDSEFRSVDMSEEPADRCEWTSFCKTVIWKHGVFDKIFAKIADDELPFFLLKSPITHEVLAPYAGGFDLILKSDARVQTLKSRWAAWLSAGKDMM